MLTIHLIAVGDKMPTWVRDACGEYIKRIRAPWALRLIEVPAERRGKNADHVKIAARETARLTRAIPQHSRVIALDRLGRARTTRDLAAQLDSWMSTFDNIALLIGGADGLPPQLLRAADEVWSLSALTFAHPLARVIVAEQLYRCHALLTGLPYHRD